MPWFSCQDALSDLRRRAFLESLRTFASVGPTTRVLDLGGGTGAAAVRFARGAPEIVVVDPARAKLLHGAAHRPGIRFVEANAEQLPFPPERFDRIISLNSFHHFADPPAALREVGRVLTEDGVYVQSDIDPDSPAGRWFHFVENRVMGHAIEFVPLERARSMLEGAGLSGVEAARLGRGYSLRGSKRTARRAIEDTRPAGP